MRVLVIPTQDVATTDKPKDWPFMEQSGKVLEHIPITWERYAKNIDGAMAIISMEYTELAKAETDSAKMQELVHLASACLYMWRMLAHVE